MECVVERGGEKENVIRHVKIKKNFIHYIIIYDFF